MAYTDRVHGDSLPVVHLDISETGIASVGVPINPAGPKLDFFGISLNNGSPADQMGVGGAIEAVIKCIQQLATVYIYQVEDSGDSNLSVAIYPTGAWTTNDLQTAIADLGTVNGFDLSSVDVYNDGFRLWF